MAKQKKPEKKALDLEQLKRLVVVAMFSDDNLMERFVLKGGNAIDLVYRVGSRASVDIDLSMADDFAPDELESVRQRLTRNLRDTFQPTGYVAFEVELEPKPISVSPELAKFWGGYKVTFKLIEGEKYNKLQGNVEDLRRNALRMGAKGKFEIDISKYEYCAAKQPQNMEGLRIFVYTPEMVIFEKMRAICQQMPGYGPVVNRTRPGAARARDFVDIFTMVDTLKLDVVTADNRRLLQHIFDAKRVPFAFLDEIPKYREFHRSDFQAVKDTMKAGIKLKEFDFYFEYVVDLCQRLKALGNV